MADRPKLGEILVRAGVVDPDCLRAALGEQRRWGRRLGQALMEMGALSEKDLVRALASQLGLPVVQLEGKEIEPEILAMVPVELAEKHGCMPLFVKEEAGVRHLYLGMEDPSDVEALDDARACSGLPITPVMVGHSDLVRAIVRSYPGASIVPPEPEARIEGLRELDLCDVAESGAESTPELSVESEVGREIDELEMTSSTELLRALVQLLIEKKVVSQAEISACLRTLKEGREAE